MEKDKKIMRNAYKNKVKISNDIKLILSIYHIFHIWYILFYYKKTLLKNVKNLLNS